MSLVQVNSRLDGNTIGTATSIRDCAQIRMQTDVGPVAALSTDNLLSSATWAVAFDPLGGSWSSGDQSRLIVPRAGLKRVYFHFYATNNNFAGDNQHYFVRVRIVAGSTEILWNKKRETATGTGLICSYNATGEWSFAGGEKLEIIYDQMMKTTNTIKAGCAIGYSSLLG